MNALEALKLARDTGAKVRPKPNPLGLVVDHDGESYRYKVKAGVDGYLGKLRLQEIFAEWEQVQEEREAA